MAVNEMAEDNQALALRQIIECLAEIGEKFSVLK
jgi:hypothetical protein